MSCETSRAILGLFYVNTRRIFTLLFKRETGNINIAIVGLHNKELSKRNHVTHSDVTEVSNSLESRRSTAKGNDVQMISAINVLHDKCD